MPELPEVETTRRGIAPHLQGQRVSRLVVRERRLRWPIPEDLAIQIEGQCFDAIERRAKYLLLRIGGGTLIGHLGMSGSLRLVPTGTPAGKHDHVDIELESGMALRYTDPRRFGALPVLMSLISFRFLRGQFFELLEARSLQLYFMHICDRGARLRRVQTLR